MQQVWNLRSVCRPSGCVAIATRASSSLSENWCLTTSRTPVSSHDVNREVQRHRWRTGSTWSRGNGALMAPCPANGQRRTRRGASASETPPSPEPRTPSARLLTRRAWPHWWRHPQKRCTANTFCDTPTPTEVNPSGPRGFKRVPAYRREMHQSLLWSQNAIPARLRQRKVDHQRG